MLCRVRSFCIIDCTNWLNLFNTEMYPLIALTTQRCNVHPLSIGLLTAKTGRDKMDWKEWWNYEAHRRSWRRRQRWMYNRNCKAASGENLWLNLGPISSKLVLGVRRHPRQRRYRSNCDRRRLASTSTEHVIQMRYLELAASKRVSMK